MPLLDVSQGPTAKIYENQQLVAMLMECAHFAFLAAPEKGEHVGFTTRRWKRQAYLDGAAAVAACGEAINVDNVQEFGPKGKTARKLKGVGRLIASKMEELLKTGRVRGLERYKIAVERGVELVWRNGVVSLPEDAGGHMDGHWAFDDQPVFEPKAAAKPKAASKAGAKPGANPKAAAKPKAASKAGAKPKEHVSMIASMGAEEPVKEEAMMTPKKRKHGDDEPSATKRSSPKRRLPVATLMSKKSSGPSGVELNEDILGKARSLGYDSSLKNLAARPEVVATGKLADELLKALEASNGLVNPAKRLLLGA